MVHQATCVAVNGRGLLIEGPPGSGKTSLALALLDRGACLVGDDAVLLERREGRLMAFPHPETRGLIEVRNLGLIVRPVCEEVPVALVLMLDEAAPRFIDAAGGIELEGVAVPCVSLWPDSPVQPIKAELALARFGLTFNEEP